MQKATDPILIQVQPNLKDIMLIRGKYTLLLVLASCQI